MSDIIKKIDKIKIKECNNIDASKDITDVMSDMVTDFLAAGEDFPEIDYLSVFIPKKDELPLAQMERAVKIADHIADRVDYPSKLNDLELIFWALSDINSQFSENEFVEDDKFPQLYGINDSHDINDSSLDNMYLHLIDNFRVMIAHLKIAVKDFDYKMMNTVIGLDFLVMLSFIEAYEFKKKELSQ